jgi:hypothetical protein
LIGFDSLRWDRVAKGETGKICRFCASRMFPIIFLVGFSRIWSDLVALGQKIEVAGWPVSAIKPTKGDLGSPATGRKRLEVPA